MIRFLLLLLLFVVPLTLLNWIYYPFDLAKWLMAGFLLSLLLATRGVLAGAVSWPKVPMRGWVTVAAIVLIQVVGMLVANPLAWADYVFYALGTAGFLFFFYQDIGERGGKVLADYALAIMAGASLVAIMGLCQVYHYNIVSDLFGVQTEEGDISSSFGNINYTGEYYGVCVLFGLYALKVLQRKALRAFVVAGIVLAATHFSFINTRSVFIAGALALGYVVWRGFIITKKDFLKLVLVCVAAIVMAHKLVPNAARAVFNEDRKKSATIRLDMWRGTLDMIADHPLGVGFNNFDFSFVPYRQKHHVDVGDDTSILNPHNEYLAVAAETGIPGALLIFLSIFYIVQRFYRHTKNHPTDPPTESIMVALILFLTVESCFQFPFEAPWPIAVLGMIMAFCLVHVFPKSEVSAARFRVWFLTLGAVNLYLVASWYMAAAALKQSSDIEKAAFACQERPQDWFPCHRYAQALMKSKQISDAEKVLKRELEKQPNNWYAMGLLGQIALDQGRKEEGCKYYKTVDDWFNQESRTHDYVMKNCGK